MSDMCYTCRCCRWLVPFVLRCCSRLYRAVRTWTTYTIVLLEIWKMKLKIEKEVIMYYSPKLILNELRLRWFFVSSYVPLLLSLRFAVFLKSVRMHVLVCGVVNLRSIYARSACCVYHFRNKTSLLLQSLKEFCRINI